MNSIHAAALAALADATTTVTNAKIELLRTKSQNLVSEPNFTLAQIQAVTTGVEYCWTIDDVITESGLTKDQVLDIVAELGTWLNHTDGSPDAEKVTVDDVSQMTLFQTAAKPLGKPKRNKEAQAQYEAAAKARRRLKGNRVVIAPGFTKADARRNVEASYVAIACVRPSDEQLIRYRDRSTQRATDELTFEHVAAVRFFAHVGRLDEIDEVNPSSPEFLSCVVRAYDLLETARADAMAGLAELVNPDTGLSQLPGAVTRMSPLFEAAASRLQRAVTYAASSPAAERTLTKERNVLARAVVEAPGRFVVTNIGDLNEGQLRRVAQAAGLRTERHTRRDEAGIRSRLTSYGFDADADMLVPLGMRATAAEIEDVFWDAVERRSEGDPAWDAELRRELAA